MTQPAFENQGGDAKVIADLLLEAGESLHEARWAAFYGPLRGPLVGVPGRKTPEGRVHLIAMVLAVLLHTVMRKRADWDVFLKVHPDGTPSSLVLIRGEKRTVVRVRMEGGKVHIGENTVSLVGGKAGYDVMRLFANHIGAFFGAPALGKTA